MAFPNGELKRQVALTGNILGASALLSIILTIFALPYLFSLFGKSQSLMLCTSLPSSTS